MKAQHIALVLHDFSTGGSERIAIRLANRWAASGRQVSLLCGTEQGAARGLVSTSIHVEACAPETVRSPWSRFQLGWRMAHLVRKHRPDIVFAPGNFHLVILAFMARKQFEKRPAFVSKLSNPVRRSGVRKYVEKLADRAIRTAAAPINVLVAMSPSLRNEAHEVFPSHDVAEISEPILEDDAVRPNRSVDVLRRPMILCAGRLCQQKNFMTAIRAFAKIAGQTNAHMVILGEGPLRKSLERELARTHLSDRIKMPGHVADIGSYMKDADLFLMTSHYEGYPAVLIEAMASGLPIVTTNCSLAIPEIMTSRSLGCVVSSHDPGEIGTAILDELKRPMPDADASSSIIECHRIGAASKAYLDLFDQTVA